MRRWQRRRSVLLEYAHDVLEHAELGGGRLMAFDQLSVQLSCSHHPLLELYDHVVVELVEVLERRRVRMWVEVRSRADED